MRQAVSSTASGKFRQDVRIGPHALIADEAVANEGTDAGPAPHELLLAALATCTSMTVKVYADRKGWVLRHAEVTVEGAHEDGAFVMRRRVALDGDLDDEQRGRLLEIAQKCPVHKTLSGTIRIATELATAPR
jgi:putative redox protein